MDIDDLKNSIDVLVDSIKKMPQTMRDLLNPRAGGPSTSEQLGTVAGSITGRLTDQFTTILPQFRSFSKELGSLVETLKEKNSILDNFKKFSTGVPTDRQGMRELATSLNSPFVRGSDRKHVMEQAKIASRLYGESLQADKENVEAGEAAKKTRDAQVDSIKKYNDSLKQKSRLDKRAASAFKARQSFTNQYLSMLRLHQAYPANASPYTSHLRALRQRERQADRLARSLAAKARKASKNVFNARGNVAKAAAANRAAVANARAASAKAAAARRRSAVAQATASTAAQGALSRGAFMAGAAGGATAVFAIFEFIKAINNAKNALADFAERTLQENRRFGGYAPKTAFTFGQFAVNDMHRNLEFAKQTSETAVRLIESVNRMRDNQQELRISGQNIRNTFGALGASFTGGFDSELGKLTGQLDRILQATGIGNTGNFWESVGAAIAKGMTFGGGDMLKMILDALKVKDNKDNKPIQAPGDQFAKDAAIERFKNGGAPRGNRKGFGDIVPEIFAQPRRP